MKIWKICMHTPHFDGCATTKTCSQFFCVFKKWVEDISPHKNTPARDWNWMEKIIEKKNNVNKVAESQRKKVKKKKKLKDFRESEAQSHWLNSRFQFSKLSLKLVTLTWDSKKAEKQWLGISFMHNINQKSFFVLNFSCE